ncbi:MAG: formyltetrahydrofolate deformylase [Microthrixaceae bacterium]
MGPTAVLLLTCPDRTGVVAAVADFVWRHGGNIVDAEQHTDPEDGVFFQRVEFELEGFAFGRDDLLRAFWPVAERFDMQVDVRFSDDRPRLAILASRAPHCLVDLLGRWSAGELPAEVVLVASNHPDHAELARFHGIPHHHLPVGDDPGAQEAALLDLLVAERVERVVLARYMRILSPAVVDTFPNRIINIHHSFLPAFVGAQPYRQAHQRGVKVIGATAHYVTEDLDEGPIIDQDVARVSHKDSVEDLARKGRDLEVTVLARAVRADLEHRVLPWGNRTIVFG